MIGTIDTKVQSHSPNFPLETLKSFVGSPSSIRVRNVPKRIGNWNITNVFVTVVYPDNTTRTIESLLTGGVYVATMEGCNVSGKVENGLTITANGKDENDNLVTGYVLGKGDVEILSAMENVSPGQTVYYIHLLEDEPDVPKNGDMYKKDGNYVVYQNGVETPLGVSQENMESYVDGKIEEAVEELEASISNVDEKVDSAKTELEGDITELQESKADASALEDYVAKETDKDGVKTAVTVGSRASGSDVGQYSLSSGVNNSVTGICNVALGYSNTTSGNYGTAIGSNNSATGGICTAIGLQANATGENSTAIGYLPTASGKYSNAIGVVSTASGSNAVAIGTKSVASHIGSFVWNGTDKTRPIQWTAYNSQAVGAFCVNPINGLSGFYIGDKTLQQVIDEVEDNIPTKTSDLANDSGFITASDPAIAQKRDLFDMNVRGTPTGNVSWFNISDGTLVENAYWYDETRWMSGMTFEVHTTSTYRVYELKKFLNEWTSLGTFSLDNKYEATLAHDGVTYTIVGYVSELATQKWVLEQLSALQTRIAALENNA